VSFRQYIIVVSHIFLVILPHQTLITPKKIKKTSNPIYTKGLDVLTLKRLLCLPIIYVKNILNLMVILKLSHSLVSKQFNEETER